MALKTTHKESSFGIGDRVKVYQKIKEGEKERTSVFEGMVIAIKNAGLNKSFTVRRMGIQGVGIERIFPLSSPFLEKVEITKHGVRGVRHAKLYYTRKKSPQEIDVIYQKALSREKTKQDAPKKKK